MFSVTTSETTRRGYHHGDLRNALIRAAAHLAATGGPDAVTVRGAAREVGVTPTAAYRHFADQAALLAAAKEMVMAGMFESMAGYLADVDEDGDPVTVAVERLTSAGRGYLRFALEEPGIFLTCFTGGLHAEDTGLENTRPEKQGQIDAEGALDDRAPYALLAQLLDRLVEVGYLDPADREGAEAGPWAAVHGLALLLIDGPLRTLSTEEREPAIEQTLRLVARGLATGPAARR